MNPEIFLNPSAIEDVFDRIAGIPTGATAFTGALFAPSAEDDYLSRLEEQDAQITERTRRIEAALRKLPVQWGKIIRWYYGLDGLTLDLVEIGRRLGLSQSEAHRRKDRAIAALGCHLAPEDDDRVKVIPFPNRRVNAGSPSDDSDGVAVA